MNKEDKIKGVCLVERIRFYKNGWGIAEVSFAPSDVEEGVLKDDGYGRIVIKGNMPELKDGNKYNIVAEYVEDPKWGDQYNVITIYEKIDFENDENSKRMFLESIFTEQQVDNMYSALADPFLALDNEDTKALITIKGCGMRTAVKWIERFHTNFGRLRIYTDLADFGLTNYMIDKLLDRYKSPDIVVEKVLKNPYILCNEISGFGWKTVDKIALRGGMKEFGVERIGAYILYYLNFAGDGGCSWITPDELMGAILDELGEEVPDSVITEAIHKHNEDGDLWWNEDKTKIGLMKYYNIENKIAEELIRIKKAESNIDQATIDNWKDKIDKLEAMQGWKFTDEQIDGIKTGLTNNITVITGGAGTGKSSLVKGILTVLNKYSFAQTSLSGRAAARLSEVTGKEGKTIHRLLGYPLGPSEKQKFVYHDENQLEYDIYIIDEISMIDAYLFYDLLRAIPDGAKVYFLGDPGQLEPIGAGNIAHDMIISEEIPTVKLTKIHRQAARSAIITESLKVRDGIQLIEKDWAGNETRGELQDLTLTCYSDKSNTYYKIMQIYSEKMSKNDFNILETQVIVPIKNSGTACTYELNNAIQELYNPKRKDKTEISLFSAGKTYILREGDKVINTKNNYKTSPEIYNGNIGIIHEIDTDYGIMTIDFVGIGRVEVDEKFWKDIEPAYAITVHKCQGSEFDTVLIGVDFSSYSLLNKELIYTAITRAKKKCELIAQTNALRMAVGNHAVSKKQTHLVNCLYDAAHPKLVF